jgi:hypothetical protein
MSQRGGQAGEAFVGLLFGTLILYFLDPIVAQAFNSSLAANPAFANSPAGDVWRLLALIFDFHLDIIGMWATFILGLLGGR